jgi:hypothetical protein
MSEYMLVDASAACDLRYVTLRYFNVAGADPAGRLGQSMPGATHLIKVALETVLRRRSYMSVYGSDYPTPTVHACGITCMFPIWLVRILRRSIICGTVVSPEPLIAAMDGVFSQRSC